MKFMNPMMGSLVPYNRRSTNCGRARETGVSGVSDRGIAP